MARRIFQREKLWWGFTRRSPRLSPSSFAVGRSRAGGELSPWVESPTLLHGRTEPQVSGRPRSVHGQDLLHPSRGKPIMSGKLTSNSTLCQRKRPQGPRPHPTPSCTMKSPSDGCRAAPAACGQVCVFPSFSTRAPAHALQRQGCLLSSRVLILLSLSPSLPTQDLVTFCPCQAPRNKIKCQTLWREEAA